MLDTPRSDISTAHNENPFVSQLQAQKEAPPEESLTRPKWMVNINECSGVGDLKTVQHVMIR